MITSSGTVCDLCGQYILLEEVYEFRVNVMDRTGHSHKDCEQLLNKWAETNDYTVLPPESPIRKGYEALK